MKNDISYRDLVAWQKAMAFVLQVYKATANFPKDEMFGLRLQLRRAAVSVPSNIAEGQGRRLPRDFQSFLRTARGSLYEAETQLILSTELGYIETTISKNLLHSASELGRVLNGLIASLRQPERGN
jgi:four helix bundle protein